MGRATTRVAGAATVVAVAGALSGCGLYPPNLVPLPGRAGTGGDAYSISVELPDVANLVQNQDVRVADVPVGNINGIRFEDWHAVVTIGLDGDTVLPPNTTARVAQKSLLGAEYLELIPPPPGRAAPGRLADGGTIPLAQAGGYVETEAVLAALSTVLNGGGLNQLSTITAELNAALNGRQPQVRELITTLSRFVGTLDGRKADIVRAIEGLDRLSTRLNQDSETVARAVDEVPKGLEVLNQQRDELVDALVAIDRLGEVAEDVIDSTQGDLEENLRHLEPVLRKLADSGSNLTQSASELLVAPFPTKTSFPSVFRGDFGNLYAIFDVQARDILLNFGVLQPTLPALLSTLPPVGAGTRSVNPLEAPFLPSPARSLPTPDTGLPLHSGGGLLPGRDRDRDPSPKQRSGDGVLGSLTGGR